MAAGTITILPEYPSVAGFKRDTIFNLNGPASYTSVSTGSPPTGGQTLKASDVGLTDFDWVEGANSDDGQFGVEVVYPNNPVGPVTSVILLWFVANTGAQVTATTNLSARTVRIKATGH